MRFKEFLNLPTLDAVIVTNGENTFQLLQEGKWIAGRFESNIRIDQPTYGAGQVHAHVYGRKENEVGAVNFDGTASHGTHCRLHDDDADALRERGFRIRTDNIVEWICLAEQPRLLIEG